MTLRFSMPPNHLASFRLRFSQSAKISGKLTFFSCVISVISDICVISVICVILIRAPMDVHSHQVGTPAAGAYASGMPLGLHAQIRDRDDTGTGRANLPLRGRRSAASALLLILPIIFH